LLNNKHSEIISVILEKQKPLTVSDIYPKLEPRECKSESLRRATYRDLKKLYENGFVTQVELDGVKHFFPTYLGKINLDVTYLNHISRMIQFE